MGGLSESLLNHGPVKVFTYEYENSNIYDNKSSSNIERVKGIKLFRKYRKANLVNNFINSQPKYQSFNCRSLEKFRINKNRKFKKNKIFCLIHSKEINHK